jgi:carboxymethylenebutenolidase
VREESVAYAHIAGSPVSGFLATPSAGARGHPALILIHEWWGLNDNIRAMARQFAAKGYTALAVDLYKGQAAGTPEQARELMMAAMQDRSSAEANLEAAMTYLREKLGVSRVATLGWCFGGGWSLSASLLMPDKVDATVIYYGRLVTDPESLQRLQSPVLGFFGALDRGIPVADVEAFQAALKELGKQAEIHIYPEADHAFANPSGTRYNAEAADDAWEKLMVFLGRELAEGP